MPTGKPIKVKYQTLVVIWFALLMSQVVFLVVVYAAKPELLAGAPPSDNFSVAAPAATGFLGDKPLITLAFAGSALIFFALGLILSRQHMRRAVRDSDASCVQTGLVLGCALSEIPSILGLILAFAFEHPYFYLWMALGAFGIILNFPRKSNLDAAMYRPL
jgi:hypothetical protein